MKKVSRLFITKDFSTFKEWFIGMFTGHTAFMQADDSQVAAFTNTSWVLREEKGELPIIYGVNIYPCTTCEVGWGMVSPQGCKSCHDDCEKIKEFYKKEYC